MRKNIKGIAAGSLGLLALQLPGMTVFAQEKPDWQMHYRIQSLVWERYSLC